jgi:hypothetical protein
MAGNWTKRGTHSSAAKVRSIKCLADYPWLIQNSVVGASYQLRLAAAAFLGVSFCILSGCGGKTHELVGRWRISSEPNAMVWEFSSDGSVLMGANRGRYSFGDNSRIKIETSFSTSVYQMEIAGDKMTLKEPSGSKLVLTRVVK